MPTKQGSRMRVASVPSVRAVTRPKKAKLIRPITTPPPMAAQIS
ncbi:Uncharacterised protein [Bordetella pertussis]|nr:Uncharacterised protein [Bordetella pertussis]